MDQLAAQYQDRIRDVGTAVTLAKVAGTAPGPAPAVATAPSENTAAPQGPESGKPPAQSSPPAAAVAKPAAPPTVSVHAQKLEPTTNADNGAADQPQGASRWPMGVAIAAVCILFLVGGFCFRRGLP